MERQGRSFELLTDLTEAEVAKMFRRAEDAELAKANPFLRR